MKKSLAILAAFGLIMSANVSSARPPLGIDRIEHYHVDAELSGDAVAQRVIYCDGSIYAWGTYTLYHYVEYRNEC